MKKSTAVHGKIIAPEDVHIISFPFKDHLPSYDAASTVVVYPSDDAMVLTQLDKNQLAALKTLVFIDCPWQKAPSILSHHSLSHLRRVKLARPPVHSKFWRYHSRGEGCLSTIEAVHGMLKEYIEVIAMTECKRYSQGVEDDLLFFFHLIYDHILDIHKQRGPCNLFDA
jgi:hypothetical protein